ncbi:MAG TPA: hypothetical protein VIZ17_12480 [Acetobacteraceae bacterium]
MDDMLARAAQSLFGRIDGPMALRLVIQPIMGASFAIWDGIKDASRHDPPYGLSLLMEPEHRGHRLQDGWRSIRKVFFVALGMDVVYQLIQLRWVYPGEALIVAQIVAVVPYLLIHGPANRISGMLRRCANRLCPVAASGTFAGD